MNDLYQKMTDEITALSELIVSKKATINMATIYDTVDVPRIALVDNGVGWEAVSDGQGAYDLWFEGNLRETDLTREDAADSLVTLYTEAKLRRVAQRIAKNN